MSTGSIGTHMYHLFASSHQPLPLFHMVMYLKWIAVLQIKLSSETIWINRVIRILIWFWVSGYLFPIACFKSTTPRLPQMYFLCTRTLDFLCTRTLVGLLYSARILEFEFLQLPQHTSSAFQYTRWQWILQNLHHCISCLVCLHALAGILYIISPQNSNGQTSTLWWTLETLMDL